MTDRDALDTARAGAGTCPACAQPRADLSRPCPHCGAGPLGPADPAGQAPDNRREGGEGAMHVRAADLEPYVGLRYVAKLFRFIALILVLLLIAEVVTGLGAQGTGALPTLMAEGSRLLVLSGILWGSGDLAILLIDIGHDVRATRILLGRQAAHQMSEHHRERRESSVREPPRTR